MRSSLLLVFLFICVQMHAQLSVSGTVYDITKNNQVENVKVESTGGIFTFTDSTGKYRIYVNEHDSLTFIYNNKPTQKFAVATIKSPEQFDISLKLPVQSKFSLLKEVKVFSKTYKQDSIENRDMYSDIFEYKKPGIKSSMSPSGVAGADLNELINIFRFRRNRQLRNFRERLQEQEEEKYINYRFNKTFVKRITGLEEPAVDTFMVWYRPDFTFVAESTELAFNQYILNSSYHFRKLVNISSRRKENQ